MYYFKKIEIDNLNPAMVEKAIRAYSLKRYTSLDLKVTTSYASEEKYFLGLESDDDLKITRLRTPFERFFPEIIIRFEKNKGFLSFQIRYGLVSTFVLCVVIAGLISNILYLPDALGNVLLLFILLFLFAGLTLMEIAITRYRINKAIRKTTEHEFLNI